jgi:hypothetical protein
MRAPIRVPVRVPVLRASGWALLALLAVASAALADPPAGKGLGRALGQAGGRGNAASGLGRAGRGMSRLGAAGRGAGLGRAASAGNGPLASSRGAPPAEGRGGWWRWRSDEAAASPAGEDLLPHQRQIDIEGANRDHRLGQADHLRALSERNGNVHLGENADRMEAFAEQHYQQRLEHWGAAPADGVSSATDGGYTGLEGQQLPGQPLPGGETAVGDAAPQEARRGLFWWRSWWPGRR